MRYWRVAILKVLTKDQRKNHQGNPKVPKGPLLNQIGSKVSKSQTESCHLKKSKSKRKSKL